MRTADFNQIVNLVTNNSDFGKRVEFSYATID